MGGRKNITVGFAYIHAVIDDPFPARLAEISDNATGKTATGAPTRAAASFASCSLPRIERVMSENATAYRRLSTDFKNAVTALGAQQRFIKPDCPWTSGRVDASTARSPQNCPTAVSSPATTTAQPGLSPCLNHYNTHQIRTGIGATPIGRVSPTS